MIVETHCHRRVSNDARNVLSDGKLNKPESQCLGNTNIEFLRAQVASQ